MGAICIKAGPTPTQSVLRALAIFAVAVVYALTGGRRLGCVPVVCPHGLRGTHATLAEDAGEAAEAVTRQLGHTDHRVTAGHYLAPGTVERGRARRALRVLQGGK